MEAPAELWRPVLAGSGPRCQSEELQQLPEVRSLLRAGEMFLVRVKVGGAKVDK